MPICRKIPQKTEFLKIQLWFRWPEWVKNRPICGRKVRLVPKSSPNFLYRKRTKIDDFIQKKLPPQKRAIFWGGRIIRGCFQQLCLNMITIFWGFHIQSFLRLTLFSEIKEEFELIKHWRTTPVVETPEKWYDPNLSLDNVVEWIIFCVFFSTLENWVCLFFFF